MIELRIENRQLTFQPKVKRDDLRDISDVLGKMNLNLMEPS
jgi:hypothetical protein